ncbi:hypothetical protein [Chamaesiphon sp.]|uniref:hypothetical protein n=1 Tax=Chamaesiphon sp. TaxID=2814140 RepID=UPI003592FB27
MASERQIQDKRESTQPDSIENGAAQQELADRAKETKKAQTSSTSPEDESTQQLESLLQSLQGDVSALNPDDALETIDRFQSLLKQSKQPAAKEIASGLKDLQKLLKRKEPSGHELGELIRHLGEQTTDIAADSDKALKTTLQNLGKQLTKIGRSLSKAEDTEQLEDLEALVDTLKQSPNQIDAKASVGEIDRWYNLLHKSDDQSLKEIATELKELKQLLKGSKTKGADLSEQLIQLGEKTTAAAATAGRGFKGAIQKVGKGLTTFGKSLAD